jgi:hypothetical protein
MRAAAKPTFPTPTIERRYEPDKLVVRLKPDAVQHFPPAESFGLEPGHAEVLPPSVAEPIDYLCENFDLRRLEPIFSPRRQELRSTLGLAPRDRFRLALATSVADVESDELSGRAVATLGLGKTTPSLIRRLSRWPGMDIVERLPARWLLSSRDPMQGSQWGLRAIRWFDRRRIDTSRVRVGILDTGIDSHHPDLPTPVLYKHDGLSDDDHPGHGTHVAGILAARTGNGVGISGIADPKLAVWKVFPDKPASDGVFYIDGERYLQALGAVATAGVTVVNLSLGGREESRNEADLFDLLVDGGVLPVAAMGNDYEEGNPTSYPAAYEGVLAVGATDRNGRRAPFSNTGPHIGLAAPGLDVLSTLPVKHSTTRPTTGYASWSGTSMATPHVTAAAAMLAAKRPSWTPAQLRERLTGTAIRLPEMGIKSWTETFGSGLLNLRAALS